jgi:orotate phosphoribosyltransferase
MQRMDQEQALAICRQNGAFITGHFVGTQGELKGEGLHMLEYFDGRVLVTKPKVIWQLAQGIASLLAERDIDVVVGMPIGALTLGSDVAKLLDVDYAMAEKVPGGLAIDRTAFVDVVSRRRVALVDDTINNGYTVGLGIQAVVRCGGEPVAIGGIFNRGSVTGEKFGVPLHTLISRQLVQVTREECLARGQCSRQEPINRKPGHGRELEMLIESGVIKTNGCVFI